MPHGRWYPTQTLLPDGRTLITSGFDEVGATNRDIDVFNPPAQRGGVGSIATIARYGSLANAPAVMNSPPGVAGSREIAWNGNSPLST